MPKKKNLRELAKAAMKMSPTAKLPQEAGGGTGGGTYTPPKSKSKKIPSSRIIYPNTPKPSTTSPNTKKCQQPLGVVQTRILKVKRILIVV